LVGTTRSASCSPRPCNNFPEKRSHSSQSRKHNKGLKFVFTLTKCSTCRASSTSLFVIIQFIIYTTKCITYELLILVWLYKYHIFSPCCFLFCRFHIPPLPKLPATNLWARPLLHRKKTLMLGFVEPSFLFDPVR